MTKKKWLILAIVVLLLTVSIVFAYKFSNKNYKNDIKEKRKTSENKENGETSIESKSEENDKEKKPENTKGNTEKGKKKVGDNSKNKNIDSDIDKLIIPKMPEIEEGSGIKIAEDIREKVKKKIKSNKNKILNETKKEKEVENNIESIKETEKETETETERETERETESETETERETESETETETERETDDNVSDKFILFNSNTKYIDGQYVYVIEDIAFISESIVGLKDTGENDGKLHEIEWIKGDFLSVEKNIAGEYEFIVQTKDDVIINGINYKNVKFTVKVLIK